MSRHDGEQSNGRLRRLMVRDNGRYLLLSLSRVSWIESDGNYLRLETGRDTYRVRGRIKDLEDRLDPERFMRIHRSFIVNLDHIREIVRGEHGELDVVVDSGDRLRLSRTYRPRFERRFELPT